MPYKKAFLSLALIAPLALAGCNTQSNASSTLMPTSITPELIAANNTSATFMANPVADASFATLINGVRTGVGAPLLTYNANLDAAAQSHSTDMVVNNYFSHTGLNGSTIGERATAAGYNWRFIGENIAQGQQSENAVLTAWQNSAGHKANNENPNFNEFGLGVAGTGSNVTWTLMLGAR